MYRLVTQNNDDGYGELMEIEHRSLEGAEGQRSRRKHICFIVSVTRNRDNEAYD